MAVYLIRAGDDGPVKIGMAKDAVARLAWLQSGHYETLRLVRTIEGWRCEERILHRHYRHLRIRNEWFRWCPTMETVEPPAVARLVKPHREVIQKLGGPSALARLLPDASINAAVKWHIRARIPAEHWLALTATEEAKNAGITLRTLAAGIVEPTQAA